MKEDTRKSDDVERREHVLRRLRIASVLCFIFLVVEHTENAADRLFNTLKKIYRRDNIGTMEKLYDKLNSSAKVTVHKTDES